MARTDIRATYKGIGRPAMVAYYGRFGQFPEPIICWVFARDRYCRLHRVSDGTTVERFGNATRVWWRAATADERAAQFATERSSAVLDRIEKLEG